MVIETSRPVAVVARELDLVEGTPGNRVNACGKNHPARKNDSSKCLIVSGKRTSDLFS
jgi:hypothetical protein